MSARLSIGYEIKPIETKEDYLEAKIAIKDLMESNELSSSQANDLAVLRILLHHYEVNHEYSDCKTGVEALKQFMEDNNFEQHNIYQLFGSRAKASEVLSGKRALSKAMIRRLNVALEIPAEVLLRE